jgi:hypothetical protein
LAVAALIATTANDAGADAGASMETEAGEVATGRWMLPQQQASDGEVGWCDDPDSGQQS